MQAASHSLADALIADPFYRSVTRACDGDEARRLQMLAAYFELALVEGRQVGRVDLADADGSGAAIWTTDTDPALRAAAYAARERALRDLLGAQGYANFSAIVDHMESNLAGWNLASAWYLSIAGIQSGAQGRGLGAALLAGGLHAVDRAGAACFLETYNQRSLPFYGRLGFEASAKFFEPVTAREYWLMVRQPRSGNLPPLSR